MIIPKNALYSKDKNAYTTFIELDSPYSINYLPIEKQEQLILWCSNFKPIKSFNQKHSSYGLKHLFEQSEHGFYITNGQLKAALIMTGFKIENIDLLNWHFNISENSVKGLKIAN